MPITASRFLPSSRIGGAILAAALVPLALEAGYLLYITHSLARQAVSDAATAKKPAGIPSLVAASVAAGPNPASDHVISYERVASHPIPISSLPHPPPPLVPSSANNEVDRPSALLTAYLRATMKAFAWTPQAVLIRAALEAPVRRTFGSGYIDALGFRHGDRVCGVYKVAFVGSRGGEVEERVELALDPPDGFRGPAVSGLIVASVEEALGDEVGESGGDDGDGDSGRSLPRRVIFVNETWLWRRVGEKPTLLESAVGRWMHSRLAAWLVVRGLGAVAERDA